MKKHLTILIAALLAIACNKPNEITIDEIKITSSNFTTNGDQISVAYPVFVDGNTADNINQFINGYITSFLGTTPDKGVKSSIDSIFVRRDRDKQISHIRYTLMTKWEVNINDKIISVIMNSYQFLGGAHGINNITVRNFNEKTGKEINIVDDIISQKKLEQMNREAFNKTYGDDPDFLKGLLINPDELKLPENIAIIENGFRVYYNQYEIAPYSYGVISYVIPL